MRRRLSLVVAVLAVLLALVACGGAEDPFADQPQEGDPDPTSEPGSPSTTASSPTVDPATLSYTVRGGFAMLDGKPMGEFYENQVELTFRQHEATGLLHFAQD